MLEPDPFGLALHELADTLKAARTGRTPDGYPTTTGHTTHAPGDDTITISDPDAFTAAATTNALQRLTQLVHGERNAGLNNVAMSLGHLVGADLLDYDQTADWLDAQAHALWPDADTANVRGTIRSGLNAGMRQPLDWTQAAPIPAAVPFTLAPPIARTVVTDPITGEQTIERTTWWPRDIGPVIRGELDPEQPPAFLERSDGRALFYAGKVNGLIGESESGKTWVALIAVAQTLKAGRPVLYLDFEDTARGIIGRLRALGVTVEELAHLTYISPDENLSGAAERDLAEALEETSPVLVIVDGYNAAMTLLGLDLSNNTEVTAFSMRVLRPMARTGACVVTIDHVTKSKDGRGSYAIGAQAKRADVDGCLIIVEVTQPFGRGQGGRLKLTVSKDRPGHVRAYSAGAKNAGEAILRSDKDTGDVDANIASPDLRPAEERGPFRPTHLMQRVSEFLEALAEPVTRNTIKTTVTGNNEAVLQALDILVSEKYAKLSGSRYESTRPFRETADSFDPSRVPRDVPARPSGTAPPRVPPSPLPTGGRGTPGEDDPWPSPWSTAGAA